MTQPTRTVRWREGIAGELRRQPTPRMCVYPFATRGCSVSLVADIGELKPGVLSVEDAARWLSLGRTVTYRLIGEGRLRSFTVGRRRLVPLAACEEYVADRLAETAQ